MCFANVQNSTKLQWEKWIKGEFKEAYVAEDWNKKCMELSTFPASVAICATTFEGVEHFEV